jgi:ketosteroid isomerase-like protein
MSPDSDSNLMKLGMALAPFEGADLVILFRSEGGAQAMRGALEKIAAPDLVTLMIGTERGLTGTFHGVDGFIEAWRDFTATFVELRNEIRELTEVGPDVIYAESRQVGTTATAGVEMDDDAAAVFRFADGSLQQAEFHLDRRAARRAAGLDPDRRSGD